MCAHPRVHRDSAHILAYAHPRNDVIFLSTGLHTNYFPRQTGGVILLTVTLENTQIKSHVVIAMKGYIQILCKFRINTNQNSQSKQEETIYLLPQEGTRISESLADSVVVYTRYLKLPLDSPSAKLIAKPMNPQRREARGEGY